MTHEIEQLHDDIEEFVRRYTWSATQLSHERVEKICEQFRIPYARERRLRTQMRDVRSSLETIDIDDERITQFRDFVGNYQVTPEEAQRQRAIEDQCREYARRFVVRMEQAETLSRGEEGIQPYLSAQTRQFNGRSAVTALESLAREPLTEEIIGERIQELERIRVAYLYPVERDNRTIAEITAANSMRGLWQGHK